MEFDSLECIEILPESQLFDERESGQTHTEYETETMFFSCIKRGDIDSVRSAMNMIFNNKVVAGKLSEDNLRQMQYWAVCCITLATRYAIQGGVDETEAFNFSDECIRKIDKMGSAKEILVFLQNQSIALTKLVALNAKNADFPYAVRKCIHYINTNLHNTISVKLLAEHCSLSEDYLSVLFKKCTGETISRFIKRKRLETARDMLNGKYNCSEIAYYLGFCSESYFIKCFKEEFGITPAKYTASLNF